MASEVLRLDIVKLKHKCVSLHSATFFQTPAESARSGWQWNKMEVADMIDKYQVVLLIVWILHL